MRSSIRYSATASATAGSWRCKRGSWDASCWARFPPTRTSRPADGMDEHLYIVAYDIADPRRWRKIFKLMNGYGAWVQLSVFQARMNKRRQAELLARIDQMIDHDADHVVLVDLGVADNVKPRVVSLGKPFHPMQREPVIV